MRKIILMALAALMMVGCDTRTEEQRYNDYLQEQKEVKRQIEYQNRWKGVWKLKNKIAKLQNQKQ